MINNRVLGIDPGLRNTGWAVVDCITNDNFAIVDCGSIKTSSKANIDERLLLIFREIGAIITKFSPHGAAIENTYVNTNFSTSLQLSQARAAAIIGIANAGIQITPYPATTIKKIITGSGNADKAQISKMLQLLMPNFTGIADKDATDAIAIAICHMYHIKKSHF